MKISSLYETLSDGIILLNKEGRVTYANTRVCHMLSLEKKAIAGILVSDFEKKLPKEFRIFMKIFAKCCKEKAIVKDQIVLGNTPSQPQMEIFAIWNKGVIIVLQDKSSYFQHMEMGKDFIANASHEFRTPITIIRGFAETLNDLPNLSKKMIQEITDKIVKTCDRLNKLVKNILVLSDIENLFSSEFQKCDLSVVIAHCKELFSSLHKNATLHVDCDNASIIGDSDLLELALMNLLDNAAKYSQDAPLVTIQLKRKSKEVILTVSDKGIGIPELDIHHVFERFYTVDKARSRKHGGAGLGLSIVKTIVEKHGGEIKVASVLGAGSTFTLSFQSQELDTVTEN